MKEKRTIKLMKTRLKIFTTILYVLACCAFLPQMQAQLPPEIPGNPDGGYAGLNTAEGSNALSGAPLTGAANTAVGWEALNFSSGAALNTGVGAGAGALITGNFQYRHWRGSAVAQPPWHK